MKIVFSRWLSAATLTVAAAMLSSCGGHGHNADANLADSSVEKKNTGPLYPDYYPKDYAKLVEQSKKESEVLIYSNVAEYNWREILHGFHAKYPWIKVATLDLGPGEAFERYYSEKSADKRSADLIAVGAPDAWQRFAADKDQAEYESPESSKVPDWSRPFPGVYTLATDPLIIIYNKALLKPSEYPESVGQLAAMASADPARWRNKITTYDASSHPFAYAVHWSVVNHGKPSGWAKMEKLGPVTRPESAGATMLDKVMSGEYLTAFYTSAVTVFPHMKEAGRSKILGWSLPKDGTPVMIRGIAVTKMARNPGSAKLLLDYMLSHEGQVAAGKGGMTPYRPDVAASEVPDLTYGEIARRLGGEDKIVTVGYDPRLLTDYKPFVARWSALFKSKH